jgi:hypothetical protein
VLPVNLRKLHESLKPFIGLSNSTTNSSGDATEEEPKKPTGKVLHTGYSRFFSLSTHACDNVTWAFWYSGYGYWEQQYLTLARRKRMNELVTLVNEEIRAAVKEAGDGFVFVDIDELFTGEEGCFCEEGVVEPDPNRIKTLFFEWNTVENSTSSASLEGQYELEGNTTHLNNPNLNAKNAISGSFEAQIVQWVDDARKKYPDARSPFLPEESTQSTSDVIPDGFLRVFHPRPKGHGYIAKLIMLELAKEQEKDKNRLYAGREEL